MSSKKVTFTACGGANFINNSAYFFRFGDDEVLGIDWGGHSKDRQRQPVTYEGPKPKWLIYSHPHDDHIGMGPLFQRDNPDTRIFATEECKILTELSWNDKIRIAERRNQNKPFTREEMSAALSGIETFHSPGPDKAHPTRLQLSDNLTVYAYHSGHVLGGVFFLMEYKREFYLFTSDICFRDRALLKGAPLINFHNNNCRAIIRESTYINRNFETRQETAVKFVKFVESILNNGGKVLIATMSIDRTQDVFSTLEDLGIVRRWPVYIDGSGRATAVYMDYLPGAKKKLSKALSFSSFREREEMARSKKPAVILSTSGMMNKGTFSAFWASRLINRGENGIASVSYQDPDGQGFMILNSTHGQLLEIDGQPCYRRACQIGQFEFSNHMDGAEGMALEYRVRPDTIVYTHGEDREIERYIRSRTGDGIQRVKSLVGKEVSL
ncbi:MAG: MBL fold metallo-hydrolase [bacterium]|nr:MBL fold metallo-hydrolase [bacterium]